MHGLVCFPTGTWCVVFCKKSHLGNRIGGGRRTRDIQPSNTWSLGRRSCRGLWLWLVAKYLHKPTRCGLWGFTAFVLPGWGDQCSEGKLLQQRLKLLSVNCWRGLGGVLLFTLSYQDFALQGAKAARQNCNYAALDCGLYKVNDEDIQVYQRKSKLQCLGSLSSLVLANAGLYGVTLVNFCPAVLQLQPIGTLLLLESSSSLSGY